MWFSHHDSNRRIHGRPPLGSANYYDYMQYVRSRFNRNEEIPAAFIEYLYERHPGKALIVFAYGAEPAGFIMTPQQRQNSLRARREIELSERIVSNATWLNENDFAERFQTALPEANEQLAKLAKHEQWWVRLYVAKVMEQNPELRQADVLRQLREDSNKLVSNTAKSVKM